MSFSEEELFDYIEKNLSKKKLGEMKKVIDQDPVLIKEVEKIKQGISVGIKLTEYETKNTTLDFKLIKEKVDREILKKKQIEKKNKKNNNNVVALIKKRIFFNLAFPKISAVAASFAIAYFAINSFFKGPLQYVWVAEYAAVRSTDGIKIEEEKPYKWSIKELGLNLRLYNVKNPDVSFKNNDKVLVDSILLLKITSELDDAKVKINNRENIVIKKGIEEIDPIIVPTSTIGTQKILIDVLSEEIVFTYEITTK